MGEWHKSTSTDLDQNWALRQGSQAFAERSFASWTRAAVWGNLQVLSPANVRRKRNAQRSGQGGSVRRVGSALCLGRLPCRPTCWATCLSQTGLLFAARLARRWLVGSEMEIGRRKGGGRDPLVQAVPAAAQPKRRPTPPPWAHTALKAAKPKRQARGPSRRFVLSLLSLSADELAAQTFIPCRRLNENRRQRNGQTRGGSKAKSGECQVPNQACRKATKPRCDPVSVVGRPTWLPDWPA